MARLPDDVAPPAGWRRARTLRESGTAQLVIPSQVVLSLRLSFAVIPLVRFTSDRIKMGEFVNPRWLNVLAWVVAAIIASLNAWLLVQTASAWVRP